LGVTARSKVVEQDADELYALPPGEFTRARDERAKALRKEGLRDEADAVKALRKPTVAAWALNQLARRRPKELERLLAAGAELRTAQQELLAGGDREAFQSAAAKERDQVARLAADAAGLAAEAGERASPALTEKVAETLHAAALDEGTAEELQAGRLVREREAIGGFGAMTAAAPTAGATAGATGRGGAEQRAPTSPRGKRRRPASADAQQRKAASAGAKRKAASADAKRRKGAADDAARRQRLAAARTDERHARRELEAATRAIEHAEARAESARTHAEEAGRRAETTAERLKVARREQAAARKAHARAERALDAAERKANPA
jgi:hypothetical protein